MTMNILQERYQFHHRQQKYHESVEEFVVEIRRLASTCQFESQEECLIRDHILFGLKNQRISMQIIQKGGNPSVTDIIEVCIESGGGRCRKPKGIGKQLAAIKPEEPGKRCQNYTKISRSAVIIEYDFFSILEFHGVIVKEEDILFQDAYFGEESELDHQGMDTEIFILRTAARFMFFRTFLFQILAGKLHTLMTRRMCLPAWRQRAQVNSRMKKFQRKSTLSGSGTVFTGILTRKVRNFRCRVGKSQLSSQSFQYVRCTICYSFIDCFPGFSESSAEEEMFGYLETSNSPDETSERPNKSRKLASERTCHICGKLSKSAYSLKLHMYTHSSVKTVPCPLCPRYFKNNRHLRSHTFNKHTIRPQAECSICRKVFKTEATLQLHNANTHPPTSDDPAGKREYECYFCHKTCISELQLRRHMYIHVRGRKMLCPQCGKCFSDVHKLNRHLKRTDHLSGQDVVKPFKCSKCDKAFMDRHGLQTHAFIHSDVAEFGCEECGKHFKTKGNLRQHQRTHFPAKYFCQYCDHKCRSSGNLQKHMKVHTGR